MVKVAVICEEDRTWALPLWERTLAVFRQSPHEVAGFWTCPCNLSGMKGTAVLRYYLKTFGLSNFMKMAAYTLVASAGRGLRAASGRGAAGFKGLCRRFRIPRLSCQDPNDPALIRWVRAKEIDILVLMTGFILKPQILGAPKKGVINKHAGLLPANRGLFPYFWAKVKGQRQGITFHKVEEEIDRGAILVQEEVDPGRAESMVAFYKEISRRYETLLVPALDALVQGRRIEPDHGYPSSYQGLPVQEDYRTFRNRGGRIIRWPDLMEAWKP